MATPLNILTTPKKFEGLPDDKVNKLGKEIFMKLHERFTRNDFFSRSEKAKTQAFFEDYGLMNDGVFVEEFIDAEGKIKTEALTFDNNTGLYTTMVANFVDEALRPRLLAAGLIKTARVDAKGASGFKVPVSTLVTAAALPDSGDVTYASSVDYTSTTITLGWVYAAQKITYELITQGNIDIIQSQLFELGDAIGRKMDSDIIAAMLAATPSNDSNSNYEALGSSTYVGYANLHQGIADAMENYADVDALLMTPASWLKLVTDSDMKTALAYSSKDGNTYPWLREVAGLKVVISNQVAAGDVYLIDSQRCGWVFEGSGVEIFDGRVSGSTAQEVIAVKLYGVGIVQPKTVFRLDENQA